MTGGGQTNPPALPVRLPPRRRCGPCRERRNGFGHDRRQPATVTFAGSAPSFVSGVVQVNVQVPIGVSGNDLQLAIAINGTSAPGA